MTGQWPVWRCPSCGTVLDGGPVFWHARCRHGAQVADVGYRLLAPVGRAA
jgi:hypothetical protein